MLGTGCTIGFLFDIDKAGSGYYGFRCWQIFWNAVDSQELPDAHLYHGDVIAKTGAGEQTVFCIGIQSIHPEDLKRARTAMMASDEFRAASADPVSVEDIDLHIPDAGKINYDGDLIGDAGTAREALDRIRNERRKAFLSAEPQVPCQEEPGAAENIEERVVKIVVKQLEVDADKVTMGASLSDDLKADSINRLEMIVVLEDAFKIEIPDEDAEKIKTVGDAVNYIKSLAAGRRVNTTQQTESRRPPQDESAAPIPTQPARPAPAAVPAPAAAPAPAAPPARVEPPPRSEPADVPRVGLAKRIASWLFKRKSIEVSQEPQAESMPGQSRDAPEPRAGSASIPTKASRGPQQKLWRAESSSEMRSLITASSEGELDALVDDIGYAEFPLNLLATSGSQQEKRAAMATHFALQLFRQNKTRQANKLLDKILDKMRGKLAAGSRTEGVSVPGEQQEAFTSAYKSGDEEAFMKILKRYKSTDSWRIDDFLRQELYDLGMEMLKQDRQPEAAILLDALMLDYPDDLDAEFWRAAAYHNIFNAKKSDGEAKQKALVAITAFMRRAEGNPKFSEKCASLCKTVRELY
jgi:acyl carrier protein